MIHKQMTIHRDENGEVINLTKTKKPRGRFIRLSNETDILIKEVRKCIPNLIVEEALCIYLQHLLSKRTKQ